MSTKKLWTKCGVVTRALTRTAPPVGRPLLIISMPRSSSSWIGMTLSATPDTRYLHEPMGRSSRSAGMEPIAELLNDEHSALIGERCATTFNEMTAQMSGHSDSMIVKYEALYASPVAMFRKLYEFADLSWVDNIERQIVETTSADNSNERQPYSIKRNTSKKYNEWISFFASHPRHLAQVNTAYLQHDPTVYLENEWTLTAELEFSNTSAREQ